jgi:chemotaxis family two-component system response regulator Rcp1
LHPAVERAILKLNLPRPARGAAHRPPPDTDPRPPMVSPAAPDPIELLLVEDHHTDIALTERAVRRLSVNVHMTVARNGVEAMALLNDPTSPTPHLVLLDIKMPLKNGWEVLAEMKADPTLRRIPVVVLTTSNDDEDIFRSRDLHAQGYVIKPVSILDFYKALERIQGYWFQTNAIPEPSP